MELVYDRYKADLVEDQSVWSEPTYWPDISNVPDNEIHMVVVESAVWGFICKVGDGTGTFSIDWGDGTVQDGLIGNGTTVFEHEHNPNGTGIIDPDGLSIWKVRVYNANAAIKLWKAAKPNLINQIINVPILAIHFGTQDIEDYSHTFSVNVAYNDSGGVSIATPWITAMSLKSCIVRSFRSCLSTDYMMTYCETLSKFIFPESWGAVQSANLMFADCRILPNINSLPRSWGNVLSAKMFLFNCRTIKKVYLPSSWENLYIIWGFFNGCTTIEGIEFPDSWNVLTTDISFLCQFCLNLRSLSIPSSWMNITSIFKAFYYCTNIVRLDFPTSWGFVNNIMNVLTDSHALRILNLPNEFGNITTADGAISYLAGVKQITGLEKIGSLSSQCSFNVFATSSPSSTRTIVLESLVSKFSFNNMNGGVIEISSVRLTNQGSLFGGTSPQISVAYGTLSRSALEILLGDIPNGLVSKTIAITGCIGTDALISKGSSGTTINSTTVTMANTSMLSAGMEVYGTGISTAKAVTFTDTGDLVNRTAHGLTTGMKISFSSITTTTGIVVNTPYYVISATADTFQVSLTLGGTAIALTTNGSGNLIAIPTIVTINENVSIVIDVPCSATASVTLTAGVLKRSIALLKGWTITN